MNDKELIVKCKSHSERQLLLAYLFGFGYRWHVTTQNTCDLNLINERWSYDVWPVVSVNRSTKSVAGYGRFKVVELHGVADNLDTIMKWVDDTIRPITLKSRLGPHIPVVYEDKVKIGCQTVSRSEFFDIFETLRDASTVGGYTFTPKLWEVNIEGGETIHVEREQLESIANAFQTLRA